MVDKYQFEEVRALPSLPVIYTEDCSQDMMDKAAKWFAKEQDVNFRSFAYHERNREKSYYYPVSCGHLAGHLESQKFNPGSDIGMLNMVSEFSRRVRAAYELPEYLVLGDALDIERLVNDPDYLPRSICGNYEPERAYLTLEQMNALLDESYKRRPDLWRVMAEERRRNLTANDVRLEFQELVRKIAEDMGYEKGRHFPACYVYMEAGHRLMRCLNIPYRYVRLLSNLPVIYTEDCTQEMVDKATEYLETEPTRKFAEFVEAEKYRDDIDTHYHLACSDLDFSSGEEDCTPISSIGRLNLASEISRRVRVAYGLPEYPVRGVPLDIERLEDPDYLPRTICGGFDLEKHGLTLEVMNTILDETCKRRPDLWLVMSEEYRRGICDTILSGFLDLVNEIAKEMGHEMTSYFQSERVRSEAVCRLRHVLNIQKDTSKGKN